MATETLSDLEVALRPPQDSDAALHAALPISAEIHRMYGGDPRHLPTRSLAFSNGWLAWLRDQPFGRIILAQGKPVGEIRLHSLSERDGSARLALGLFREETLGHGIGRHAIRQALAYAFGPMKLHRVDLRVLAYNTRAIRCYKACGFRHEGTQREAAWDGEVRHDDWIMAILAPEYQRHNAKKP